MIRPRVCALGGGHGLAASLTALRHLTDSITAIVTVADDGGSSGRLRQEYDVLPPGDLRMALAALCDESEWGRLWREVLQRRFDGDGPLGGHALGNLLLLALWDVLGDPVRGLQTAGRLIGIHGTVLPMALLPLQIVADVVGLDPGAPEDVTLVHGQNAVAKTCGAVLGVRLEPADPPACPEALAALRDADWVILGPGSWFTSVMPHLLVPELRQTLTDTAARRVLTLNLTLNTAETSGFSAATHLEVLSAHAPGLGLDVVLADPRVVDDAAALREVAAGLGAEVVITPVADVEDPTRHDELRLAAAYRDVFG